MKELVVNEEKKALLPKLAKVISKVGAVTTSNYQPTYTLQQIINGAGLYQTKLSISLVIVELLEISGFENTISKPETLALVVDEIINQYPNLEIAELSIALREGITGKYGPTYNRIAIDTIGTWIKAYYQVSWPEIERRAVNANISKAITARENDKAVPMPQWYKEKLAQLELATKKAISVSKEKTSKYVYISIADYCHRNSISEEDIKLQYPCPEGIPAELYEKYLVTQFNK